MLFSPSALIALAHYPKTAGGSVKTWFRGQFPDAVYVEPGNPHVPVRTALERLGLAAAPVRRSKIVREGLRLFSHVAPGALASRSRCDLTIIGVVREPLAMLVSLYEYWRRCEFEEEPSAALVRAARVGTFREFVELAVVARHLPSYRQWFDVHGPAWKTTRLIDFDSLEPGLAAVCRELDIAPPECLPRRNVAPSRTRDIAVYRDEIDRLLPQVRRHFRWYHREAARILVRGAAPPRLRAA